MLWKNLFQAISINNKMFKSILLSFCVVTAFAGANGTYTKVKSSKTCSVPVVCDEEGTVTTEWKAYAARKGCQSPGNGVNEDAAAELQAMIDELINSQSEIRKDMEQLQQFSQATDNRLHKMLTGDCDVVYDGKCFFGRFPNGRARNTNFYEAKDVCTQYFATPTNVYSEEHYNLLQEYMRQRIGEGQTEIAVWTGMGADSVKGVWTLTTGDSVPSVPWYEAPDNHNPKVGSQWAARTNIVLHTDKDPESEAQGLFNWLPNLSTHGVICETEIPK